MRLILYNAIIPKPNQPNLTTGKSNLPSGVQRAGGRCKPVHQGHVKIIPEEKC